MIREDNFLVTVSVTWRGETRNLGIFDTKEGGNMTADDSKYRRGGMGPSRAVGGPPEAENVTVARDWDLARDKQHLKWLMNAVGSARMSVKQTFLDEGGLAGGSADDALIQTGVLTGCNPPGHDSNSSSVAMIELTMATDGAAG